MCPGNLDPRQDAFTYAYDCTGDVAWLAETPSSQIPTVAQCQGAGGTVAATPAPSAGGTTYVVTSYGYSPGSSGNLLSYQTTAAVTSSGSSDLLDFGRASNAMTYDPNNNLTSVTPYVSGTAQNADNFGYDNLQRVASGPETSGSKTTYSYINSGSSQPYQSHNTVDQMGIDAMPQPGSAAQLGSEYQGNGELCWVAQVTSTTGTCSNPGGSSTNYETVSYNSSGDLTGTAANGYGATSALTWNVDTNEPTCINPSSGSSCTGPSSSQPQAAAYRYNADGLRMMTQTWNNSISSVVTTQFTWAGSALISNGAFDYLYGSNRNMPIAQIDNANGVTGALLPGPSPSARGIVEVSTMAANPFVLDNYTDFDAYGNPLTSSGGVVNPGGLTSEGKTGDADSASAFGFGGGYQDGSGLIYLVHRYYDPTLGQFISLDPAVNATSTAFAYGLDNPIANTDPSGLHPKTCFNKYLTSEAHRLGNGMYCWSVRGSSQVEGSIISDSQNLCNYYGNNVLDQNLYLACLGGASGADSVYLGYVVGFSGPGGGQFYPFIHQTSDVAGSLASSRGQIVGVGSSGDILNLAVGYAWHLVNDSAGNLNVNNEAESCPAHFAARPSYLSAWVGCWMGGARQYGTVRLAGRIGGATKTYAEGPYTLKVIAALQVAPSSSAGANQKGVSMGWEVAKHISEADDFATMGEAGVLAWAA